MTTVMVDPLSSSRVGQVTFCISARTSAIKFLTFCNITRMRSLIRLGLLGFGLTTFLLNVHNAGGFEMNSMILAMALVYGGAA